jgi:hypothetical protein
LLGAHLLVDSELRKAIAHAGDMVVRFGVLPSGALFGDDGLRGGAGMPYPSAVAFLRRAGATVFCAIPAGTEHLSPAQRRGAQKKSGQAERARGTAA